MKKLNSIILKMDFLKFFKRFLAVSLAVVILGGIIIGISFRTQISEGISFAQALEREGDGFEPDVNDRMQDRKTMGQYEYRGRSERDWPEFVPFTEPSTGAKLTAGIFVCLCLLIFAVYWLAVAAWLYKAAVLSGMNRWLWSIAGLIGNMLSVLVFLIVRSAVRGRCPSCGRWHRKGARYCANCGAKQQENCPSCGEACESGDRYCPSCGKPLRETDLQGS